MNTAFVMVAITASALSLLIVALIAWQEAPPRLRQWRTRREDHRAVREFIRHEIRVQRAQARYLEAERRKSGRAA